MTPSPSARAAPGLHPLEAILPSRRLRRSPLHDIGYTLVLNCLVALVLVSTVFSVITIRVMLLLVERRVARATALPRQQEQVATASRLLSSSSTSGCPA